MTRGRRFGLLLQASLLLFTLGTVGCSSDSGDDTQDNIDDGGDDGGTATGSMQVKLSGAVALLAQDQTVTETAKPYQKISSKTGEPLFTYEVVNQGLTEEAAASLRKTRPAGVVAGVSSETTVAGTNLLAVDAEGNASLAIESDLPIKVMYSVADPAGEYVYLALDTGWWNWDGNDYTQFIAKNNCAFYRVKIADDTFSCVQEGVFVQNMDDTYMQSISGNQKPVQFDDDSNVYYTATTFTRECDDGWDMNNDGTITEDERWCWVNNTSWNPRIYKMAAADGAVTAVTQDNASVQFFLALSTGEIAYQSHNTETWESSLYLWQNSQTINLTDNGWGINFFATDTGNTVMWGDWETAGIRFGRPVAGGGVHRATLNTTLFGNNAQYSTTPRRIIAGDDGRLYGVFESWRYEADPEDLDPNDGQDYIWTAVLSVYTILPYDPVPKVELTLGDDWWNWMSDTPFQISKGFLYYTETQNVTIDGASYGTADAIHMIRLDDRNHQMVLSNGLTDATAPRYEIYSWRLSGDELHFSALDKSRTVVVTGKIDTTLVKQGAAEAEYLTITDSASAVGSTAKIQDIEIITPKQPATDTGLDPVVQEFHVSEDNRYSVSVDFSKYMDKSSVEENMTFAEGTADAPGTAVPTMKLWLYQTLHLIPDLSSVDAPLGDTTTAPLANGTTYTLTFGDGTRDAYDWLLASGPNDKSATWTTLPAWGWYNASTDSESVFTSAKIAKYLGRKDINNWYPETYDLNVDARGHIRVEFSARNLSWEGIDLVLWNKTEAVNYPSYPYAVYDAKVMFNSGSVDMEYKDWYESIYTYNYYSSWAWHSDPAVFNGNWARYRVDFYDTNIRVYYANSQDDLGNWEFVELTGLAVSDLETRDTSLNTNDYTLMVRVIEPLNLDDFVVSSLDASGNLAGSEGDIADFDFESGIGGLGTNIDSLINPDGSWW